MALIPPEEKEKLLAGPQESTSPLIPPSLKEHLIKGPIAPFNQKPILKNEDGSVSTEQSITITSKDARGKDIYVNIPTIKDGQKLSDEEAEDLWNQGQIETLGIFTDLDKAVGDAKARSESIGKSIDKERSDKEREDSINPFSTMFNTMKAFISHDPKTPMKIGNLKEEVESVVGAADTLVHFGTSFLAAIPATPAAVTAGYLEQFTDDPAPGDEFLKTFSSIQEALTVEPKTKAGRALINDIGEALDFSNSADTAGRYVLAKTGSAGLATIVHTLIEGAPVWAPFVGGKGVGMYRGKKDIAVAEDYVKRMEEVKAEEIPGERFDITEFKAESKDLKAKSTEIGKAEPDLDVKFRTEFEPQIEGAKGKTKKTKTAKPETADSVESNFNKMREAKKIQEKALHRSLKDRFLEGVVDSQAKLKRVLKQGGDAAKEALMNVELMAGATPKAYLKAKKAGDLIYEGLDKKAIETFDHMVNALRSIQIIKNKGEGNVSRPTGKTVKAHKEWLKAKYSELGEGQFNDLMRRAQDYFITTNNILRNYYAEGLITKEAFNKMKNDVYEPSKFLDHIDPIKTSGIKKGKGDVRESGVEFMGRGSQKALELDSRQLLFEYLVRSENRIFKNRALKNIAKYTELDPNNGWVQFRKRSVTDVDKKGKPLFRIDEKTGDIIPETRIKRERIGETSPVYDTLDFFDNGIKQSLRMDKLIADQFALRDPQTTSNMASVIRLMSGSFLLRPLATGVNPEFALKNFPRDIIHTYLATGGEAGVYSTHLPKFISQMIPDLATTMVDAFTKKGRYEDYINEGGGMNFLTSQGAELLGGKTSPLTHRGLGKLKEAMTRINEAFELWVRLAARERGLKNGLSAEESTWHARRILDFSQGGKYAKAIDHGIPYLNASIQAFRTSLRSAKEKPTDFAVKAGWLAGTAGMIWLANYQINPQGWKQVSARERRENFIFMTPFKTLDENNNPRHLYFKIKKDNAMIPFTFLVESGLERTLEGKIPSDDILDLVRSSMPIVPVDSLPPSVSAMLAGTQNLDLWTSDRIWKGDENVPPELRFNPPDHAHPTPEFWKMLGRDLGISPMETQRALTKVIPSNIFTDMAGKGINDIYSQLSDKEQVNATNLILKEYPFIRKFASYTHPASRELEGIQEAKQTEAGEALQLKQEIQRWVKQFNDKTISEAELGKKFRTIEDPAKREQAFKGFKSKIILDRIFRRKRAEGVPSKSWWRGMNLDVGSLDRAEEYYRVWKGNDAIARTEMEAMADRLPGFRDAVFQKQLKMLRREQGTEQNN